MRIIVLGGGNSPEREVSLRSAKGIEDGARQAGFDVQFADPAEDLNFLDNLSPSVIILPILHGQGGEDGTIQAELEKRNLPFLGSSSKVSANCFNKWKARQEFERAGIKVAKAALVTKETYYDHPLAQKPHVLKVTEGGSSIGTLIVRTDGPALPGMAEQVFKMKAQPLLEELIEGVEVTVPILDQVALSPIEVRPPEGEEFDYNNKYNGKTGELLPPPSLNADQIRRAQKIAESVHRAMGVRHLSRVDLMMKPDGSFFTLEINTIPGLTDQSLFPKAAAYAGLSMSELVKRFIELVKRDYSL